MDILVSADGWLAWRGGRVRCALGRSGVRLDKREGDGATPAGTFPLRRVLYRPDRLASPPATALPLAPIHEDDGWCDGPGDPAYNRPVRLPYPGRHERLWRDDGLYDLLAVIGYNDAPVEADRGSAIFLHVAAADFAPTAGCVALERTALIALIAAAAPGDRLIIRSAPDAPCPA
jgi:L,D-peptidoglycan transpeptidase YkuD (ErfK/YbiS/YcfS/YnhG family)